MRLPPVISATLFWRSIEGGRGRTGAGPAWLIAERAEERRPLVRVAPFGAQRRAGEDVLRRHANRRIVDRGERVEPLHRTAGGIVGEVLVHIEGNLTGGDLNLAAVIGELNRRRRHLDNR